MNLKEKQVLFYVHFVEDGLGLSPCIALLCATGYGHLGRCYSSEDFGSVQFACS